jgi:hypothetical protein
LKAAAITSTLTSAKEMLLSMVPMKKRPTFLVIIVMLVVTACAQQDNPVQAVENYLKLRVASDAPKLLAASCKDWEGQATVEAASFQSMNAKLDNMACKQTTIDGPFQIVACTGQIITTYAGETRNWDLAAKNFKVLKEDGQWKMCGYQ